MGQGGTVALGRLEGAGGCSAEVEGAEVETVAVVETEATEEVVNG